VTPRRERRCLRGRIPSALSALDPDPHGTHARTVPRRATGRNPPSAARFANPPAEELGRTELRMTFLALHGERGSDRRPARGAAGAQLPATPWARAGQLALGLGEVPHRVPARETERDPVAEGLPPLFLDPVALGACQAQCGSISDRTRTSAAWSSPAASTS
jgi:hypothetical protein